MYIRIVNREYDGVIRYDLYKEGNLIFRNLGDRDIQDFILNEIRTTDIVKCCLTNGILSNFSVAELKEQATMGPSQYYEYTRTKGNA